uniref:Immunoglobulin V-set domain-containing protein n=1 Tax=Sinocyclocheilus anshuiensis TaxID=1608454 RepID=A0A671PTW0_9TELE
VMTFLIVFSLVLTGVLMKSGNVYEGTVGETVEIRCPYRDDYKYTPKYFCRHPCKSDRVLIKSAKSDQVVSNGRYSLIDIVSGLFFTVTIKHLRLTDSGVYHCGIDQWFSDTLNKVSQTVHVDDVHHLYDEIVTEYSLAGPARDGNSFIICSTVQHCDPAPQNDMNALYSLITHH